MLVRTITEVNLNSIQLSAVSLRFTGPSALRFRMDFLDGLMNFAVSDVDIFLSGKTIA